MSDNRYAVIHFTDGSSKKIEFPEQSDDINVSDKIQKLINNSSLMIEVEGSLMIIPISSIKYIQSYPGPNILPDSVIKGAVLID
jgi:hypothetical protein